MLARAKRRGGENARLTQELDRLRPLVPERDKTIAALENELGECKRRIAEQQTDLARARNDAERHFKAADALGRLLSRLRPAPAPHEDAQLQHQAPQLETQLQDARDQLQAALQVIHTQDEELERNAHVSQRLISALEGQLGRMREALAVGDTPQAASEAAVDVKTEELHSLQALADQLQGRVALLEGRIRELEGELSDRLDTQETTAQPVSDLDAARAQVRQLQASCAEHMQDLRWLESALSDSTRREKKLDAVVADQAHRLAVLTEQLSEQLSVVEGLRCVLLVVQQRLATRDAGTPKPQPSTSKRESQLQALARALEATSADIPTVPSRDTQDETHILEAQLAGPSDDGDLREAQQRIDAQAGEITELTERLRDTENRLATQEDFIRSELSWRAFTRDAEKARGDLLQKELDGVRAQLASTGRPSKLWHKIIGRGSRYLQ